MSQEKVDRYKNQKLNRKKIAKKEKRMRVLTYTTTVVLCIVFLGWAGWSGYRIYEKNKPVSQTEVNMDALSNYYSKLDVK
jgi:TRAP-type C4-dicarboxylate transport system permease small subunit